ncbi:ATP-dependent DNA helicase RecG [Siphonobacter curvatus]|uniref:ATP-dependent DNA helicase RecG n=1 Tax=Siphonobacter curvatus TaxID=2094562 RepID=A0A2S7IIJ4_9BACT|nr:ATP-dependent DNA helicase RecG [Siphonobacter curvatus]PQA56085.1 ATP-dependent DNA helicase RecG [Siphonobacter curvatus]
MDRPTNFFDTKIEFLKGVGPQKGALLNTELNIFTFGDLLQHYPFRYEDRTRFFRISELREEMAGAQIKGRLRTWEVIGEGHKARLVGQFSDGSGTMELTWFQGISFLEKSLHRDGQYIVYGKPTSFNGKFQIVHPEMDLLTAENEKGGYWQPVYNLTEKLRKRYVDAKAIAKWQRQVLELAGPHIRETLPSFLIEKYRLASKAQALWGIHAPENEQHIHQAKRRLKFEELFYNQLRLIKQKILRRTEYPGQVFQRTQLIRDFYEKHLPFDLTGAQKRVIREIFEDMRSGKQMNRLLQGDVGSGKTIVAFICMLLAIENEAQACLMAPTEILADQHFKGLLPFAEAMGLRMSKLTGSTPKKDRKVLHEGLLDGSIHIVVGTHALLEDIVQFKNLGLVVIDEQHRFGVAQRAKLWQKNEVIYPHILVMTATPIPRTLAMTLYGDLDLSQIDELPPGRKPIVTRWKSDQHRLEVFGFVRNELQKGRQIYIVYPLIEESEKLDFKDLMDGYESVVRAFPDYQISIVHGKMPAKDKDFEMQRFISRETMLMVATTVIEVGVNVPNASVMIIESAERFGLSQLHQLRGRVGRGADQSYCILMTGLKLSAETRTRMKVMTETNDGFVIADTDLRLRGPGDMAGTQQSGVVDLLLADLSKDGEILKAARESAQGILEEDPELVLPKNQAIRSQLDQIRENESNWARIS